jgi:prepilin-type N-terminal cleavage/methylation domain-containing protein
MTRHARGFTLAEVLIAAVLAAIGLVAATTALSAASSSKAALEDRPVIAANLAEELLALAETLPRSPSGVEGATEGVQVTGLDALHGAVFSPPLRADKSADATLAGWEQACSLEVYALDDLETPTGEDLATALAPHAARLCRLRVVVSCDDAEVETFSWWLTP